MADLCPAPFTVSCELSRIDAEVNFRWNYDSPLVDVAYLLLGVQEFPSDFWSAEWVGFIFPPEA